VGQGVFRGRKGDRERGRESIWKKDDRPEKKEWVKETSNPEKARGVKGSKTPRREVREPYWRMNKKSYGARGKKKGSLSFCLLFEAGTKGPTRKDTIGGLHMKSKKAGEY